MTAFSYNKAEKTFKVSATLADAAVLYPNVPSFDSEDSLAANELISMSDMATIYNQLSEVDNHVNKFKDRSVAVKRTWTIVNDRVEAAIKAGTLTVGVAPKGEGEAVAPVLEGEVLPPGENQPATTTTAPVVQEPTPPVDEPQPQTEAAKPTADHSKANGAVRKRGRQPGTGEFAGRKLFPKAEGNPRREGTKGHKSYAVVAARPGIEYSAYLASGGRPQDLRWDVSRNWIEVK